MIFPEPGCGPTFEIDEFWEDADLSPELLMKLRELGDRAAELYAWLDGDIVA